MLRVFSVCVHISKANSMAAIAAAAYKASTGPFTTESGNIVFTFPPTIKKANIIGNVYTDEHVYFKIAVNVSTISFEVNSIIDAVVSKPPNQAGVPLDIFAERPDKKTVLVAKAFAPSVNVATSHDLHSKIDLDTLRVGQVVKIKIMRNPVISENIHVVCKVLTADGHDDGETSTVMEDDIADDDDIDDESDGDDISISSGDIEDNSGSEVGEDVEDIEDIEDDEALLELEDDAEIDIDIEDPDTTLYPNNNNDGGSDVEN